MVTDEDMMWPGHWLGLELSEFFSDALTLLVG